MKIIFLIFFLISIFEFSKNGESMISHHQEIANSIVGFAIKSDTSEFSCKLTTKELQERKATVIGSLRKQVLETKELSNGYAFKFTGSDKVLDELIEFVKTERQCCDFFTFTLSFSGDGSEAWLELTGPEGTKDFISTELGL